MVEERLPANDKRPVQFYMKITTTLTDEQVRLFTADRWTAKEYAELDIIAKELITEALRKAVR